MELRGSRRCQSCGTEWSYYETGEVACPHCGSLESVGTDDQRQLHTDTPRALDFGGFASRIAEEPVDRYAEELGSALRSYTQARGFISGGELLALDGTYVAARELLHVVDVLSRRRTPTEAEELHLLSVFEFLVSRADSDDGRPQSGNGTGVGSTAANSSVTDDWPQSTTVPRTLHAARGLAVTDAVEAYRRDLRTWLDSHPDPEATRTLGTLRTQCKRLEALGGDVPPSEPAALIASARNVGHYLRTGDRDSLAAARDRLDGL